MIIKFYKSLVMPVKLDHKKKKWERIEWSKMKFLRKTKGCTKLDHKNNETLRKEPDVRSIDEEIQKYRNKWKGQMNQDF